MIASMTGFGRAALEEDGVRIQVEIRSVNSRFCDVQVRCPGRIQSFEPLVREQIQQRIARGKVSVHVEWTEEGGGAGIPVLDEELAARYLQGLERLRVLGRLEGQIDPASLMNLPGLFRMEEDPSDPERTRALLQEVVGEALDEFERMRTAEGEALSQDLRQRVAHIEELLDQIERLASESREQIRTRLREKVETLLRPGEIDEERIALEVVLIAERIDVTEEIVRFRSHDAQFLATLDRGGEVGRRLNFLLQEMNREANTISSKAADAELVHLVVEVKEEVERMREQVQNLA